MLLYLERNQGNTLSAPETTLVIEQAITIGEKPLEDRLAAFVHFDIAYLDLHVTAVNQPSSGPSQIEPVFAAERGGITTVLPAMVHSVEAHAERVVRLMRCAGIDGRAQMVEFDHRCRAIGHGASMRFDPVAVPPPDLTFRSSSQFLGPWRERSSRSSGKRWSWSAIDTDRGGTGRRKLNWWYRQSRRTDLIGRNELQ
jgi:hypothetical protein